MMKYTRLTKQQLEALHHDFARFLAAQQITAEEWQQIKEQKPEVAEQELDIFSDLVWERSLQKVKFLEKIEPQSIFCFEVGQTQIQMLSVRVINPEVDLNTLEGMLWLTRHFNDESVQMYQGNKAFSQERNMEIFELILQGVVICEGDLFRSLSQMLKQ
ncbi:hypothetical protein DKB58_10680 [Capnocytophaga canimorsus]|uniref:DUF6495 family protein n=2 Tax=Capnocytophaga canimorsus TaxID=28188 RepID=UPI000D6E87FC|nr:DUF6495 family protein [Capnocytophaga canimorsus]AWL79364.1 hypothetical protein DKB58_10680 [Capnocytophaga canimorsus]AYW35939.1 hypothetical protein D8L92_00360 [Capnocytophaga canimorsus]MDT9498821.1 hypothetical protein [Capnocytophaga canimorsus]